MNKLKWKRNLRNKQNLQKMNADIKQASTQLETTLKSKAKALNTQIQGSQLEKDKTSDPLAFTETRTRVGNVRDQGGQDSI